MSNAEIIKELREMIKAIYIYYCYNFNCFEIGTRYMSQLKYCQGPKCHEHTTKDRIRGSKGDKHYETRKRSRSIISVAMRVICVVRTSGLQSLANMAVNHFGRIREPKRTDASGAWYKDYGYDRGQDYNVLIIITSSSMIYLANADQLQNNNTMMKI